MKAANERYTIAVDFDGVIHSYTSPWVNEHTIPDEPVPGAMEWLNEISKKFVVVVHTTRARTAAGANAVQAWITKHGGPLVGAVTNKKHAALIYIDDRAWRFTGSNFPTNEEIHAARPWNKELKCP